MNYEELLWIWIAACYNDFGEVLPINNIEHDEHGNTVIGYEATKEFVTLSGESITAFKLGYRAKETAH